MTFKKIFSYKNQVYGAVFLTGLSALIGQTVWQRYLAVLTGAEAKSISLTLAVFLSAFAAGYLFFGKYAQAGKPRFKLLKLCGYIEWVTALYLSVFHFYYQGLKPLSYRFPDFLIFDLLLAALALFIPVFLMGASIPLLTAALPESPIDAGRTHSAIYGWNALGAFAGVLVAGFYLIPVFGFKLTLVSAGLLNFTAGLVFVAGRLQGEVLQKQEAPCIASALSNKFYMAFAFLTGAVVISLEILFVRLLNLSLGAGVYNFPVALSLFVGGIGLGSLLLPEKPVFKYFFRQIVFALIFLGLAFFTAPYWSVWLSHIRVTLLSVPFNYWRFKLETYIFCSVFIFPVAFFLGRLLPLSYYFLKKSGEGLGPACGKLYFFNTLGTVSGAVVIGYLAFYLFNLEGLFKLNLMALAGVSAVILFQEKRRFLSGLTAALTISILFVPEWDRTGHSFGYFRLRKPADWHFKKWFDLPNAAPLSERTFLKDGPNSTASVLAAKEKITSGELLKHFPEMTVSYAVIVNGKSDGSFINDFSTMYFLSALPYFFAPSGSNLQTAVIGLGTGVSSDVLGKLSDVGQVVTVEISPAVISALKSAPATMLNVFSNPKIRIVTGDAFKYFTRVKQTYDLIVSEPSNPWVTGVENLFSAEFYKLARKKLAPGGVLAQWIHTYAMDAKTFQMICNTVSREFPFTEIYLVGNDDMAILASDKPFDYGERFKKRFFDPALLPIHQSLGLVSPEDIYLIRILESDRYKQIMFEGSGIHTLTEPKLTYRADKAFFLGSKVSLFDILPGPLPRGGAAEEIRIRRFQRYLELSDSELQARCRIPSAGWTIFCRHIATVRNEFGIFQNQKNPIGARFQSYGRLRILGLIPYNEAFMQTVRQWIIQDEIQNRPLLFGYIHQILFYKGRERTRADAARLPLNEDLKKDLMNYIETLSRFF